MPSTTNIAIFGESGVGKTCFTDMFLSGQHFTSYDPTVADSTQKEILVDNTLHRLDLMDVSSSLSHDPSNPIFTNEYYLFVLSRACGIVLLYDITCLKSYEDITTRGYFHVYLNRPHFACGRQRLGCVLVGTKKDLADEENGKREVDEDLAREWAESQGMACFEVDKWMSKGIDEVMRELVRDIGRKKRRDEEDNELLMEREKASKKSEAKKTRKGSQQGMFPSLGDAFRNVLPKSKSVS
ncbi:P-loop containing nucleoside triphosphate hydrolase protein [Melanomma pulvis-pyrius CBS 109.77]|uniref:P-loop containing nucleoside triphosphate hydrolase protein n=1 Tax=Melanomma pulvis-pyrius CBS 109.77 TaxID=1314802 RepID=A0A6A6XGE5_9PLEO|nr:P-loop containing nucleoside triphosphate hydrolase protein [Melanomma pulvis-pyrius CBS 109.77]